MYVIKYFVLYIVIFALLQINIFANPFKLLSRKGEVSVIVTEDNADIDFRESFPEDYFSITTKEYSYLVIDNGRESLILMPSSKLTYDNSKFTLHEGCMYVKSKHNDEIEMKFSKDNKSYTVAGKAFTVLSYNDDISILTHTTVAKIIPDDSWGAIYYLEPNRKSTILPSIAGPFNITANEKTLIDTVSRQLESEVNSHLNKDIERYSFKILEGTKNETTIYRLVHPTPGPNVFLIAPHGSERVGTDVAIERINMPIKKGSMTIVPIAVPQAYANNLRAIEGQDINNRFFENKQRIKTYTDRLAQKYMDMLEDYDITLVLTLHEGNGVKEFFGDSIIYDTRKLDNTVSKVLDKINNRIIPMNLKFKQMYYPMPTTLTYYATQKNIDAYGIELTRNLDYDKKRIIMHTILSEFLRIYGME